MFKEILLEGNMELYGRYFKKAVFKTIYHHPLHLSAEQKAERGAESDPQRADPDLLWAAGLPSRVEGAGL